MNMGEEKNLSQLSFPFLTIQLLHRFTQEGGITIRPVQAKEIGLTQLQSISQNNDFNTYQFGGP